MFLKCSDSALRVEPPVVPLLRNKCSGRGGRGTHLLPQEPTGSVQPHEKRERERDLHGRLAGRGDSLKKMKNVA